MILMMHESGEVYVYMMRYFLGTNERTNERTNKAILGVGYAQCIAHVHAMYCNTFVTIFALIFHISSPIG